MGLRTGAFKQWKSAVICRRFAARSSQGKAISLRPCSFRGISNGKKGSDGETIAPEVKRQLFSQIEGLSTRETERVLAARLPEEPGPDKFRTISGEHTQVSFTADQELLEMLARIKDLVAHQNANPSLLDLFKLMAKKTLEKIDPIEKAKRARPRKTPAPGKSRRPDAATRYALTQRDQERCQYVDSKAGRKCEASRAPQTEHKIPFALGGETELSNLELLCRAHNQLRAIEVYGAKKMARYLKS